VAPPLARFRRELESFIALAEALSFHRAAEPSHITQSTLSYRIKELEDEIGAKLFRREPPRTSLTAAGHALLGEARIMLTQMEESFALVQRAASGSSDVLAIGYLESVTTTPLPDTIGSLRQQYPEIKLELQSSTSPPSSHD